MNDITKYMMNPARQLGLWAQMARMGFEAQLVIGMRVAGMMGLANQPVTEPLRMVAEKQHAATEAMQALIVGAARGDSPDTLFSAAMTPYSRRTRANTRRLARRRRKG